MEKFNIEEIKKFDSWKDISIQDFKKRLQIKITNIFGPEENTRILRESIKDFIDTEIMAYCYDNQIKPTFKSYVDEDNPYYVVLIPLLKGGTNGN